MSVNSRRRASEPTTYLTRRSDFKRLYYNTLTEDETSRQSTARSSATQESQLLMILEAVAGSHESVDEHFALMQEIFAHNLDMEQINETTSEEMSSAVREKLKVTEHCEIMSTVQEGVVKTVQQQVAEVVRRNVVKDDTDDSMSRVQNIVCLLPVS